MVLGTMLLCQFMTILPYVTMIDASVGAISMQVALVMTKVLAFRTALAFHLAQRLTILVDCRVVGSQC